MGDLGVGRGFWGLRAFSSSFLPWDGDEGSKRAPSPLGNLCLKKNAREGENQELTMRVNLNCPYSEKDQAKWLGARWDPAQRVWYVVGIEDLTPFKRWLGEAPDRPPERPRRHDGPKVNYEAPIVTKARQIASCGCTHALPWEDCEHTSATQH